MASDPHTPPPVESPRAARRQRASRLSRRKRLAFLAVALALAAALLVAVEAALRLAGFGGYPPTFVPVGTLEGGGTLVVTQVDGPVSYFIAGRTEAMALDPVAFRMPKPEGTLRVMWLGASAAKGIPQPRHLRAAAFLQSMLGDLHPDRRVEVLNVAVPGIAAFPVLDIMAESLDYDPDLVVAYLGNNEFYGAYGVASIHSAGRSATMIRLIRTVRATAIAQAFDALRTGPRPQPAGAVMERMVGESFIAPDDPIRDAAARNLETFVGDMIDRCADAGVPIVVCLPPRNESGLAPLGEARLNALPADAYTEVQRLMADAETLLIEDPATVEASMRRVIELHPTHARAHFLLGRALAERGRFEPAGEAFRRAVDLDTMPWRPPSDAVAAIRRAAQARGAILADLPAAFRARSEVGSPGWALLDDHVHPTLQGQVVVARTVAEAMSALPGPLRVDPGAVAALPDWSQYAHRHGANPYDAYAVAHAMRMLGSVSFFQRSNPQMLRMNDDRCRAIEAEATPPVVQALRAWADPQRHMVDRYPVTGMVADAMLQAGRVVEAEPLFRIAAQASTPWTAREIGFVYFSLYARTLRREPLDETDRARARRAIDRARFLIREERGEVVQATRFAGQLHALLGEHEAAIGLLEHARAELRGDHRVAAEWTLIQSYVALGQGQRAMEIIHAGLQTEHAPAYEQMGMLLR